MSNDESAPTLIRVLTEKLKDRNFALKVHDNYQHNMNLNYNKYLEKRLNNFKNEFSKINKNIEDGITIDELNSFINSYSSDIGREFDHEYAQRLYSDLDLDKNNQITIQEFIFSYILLEERMRVKQLNLSQLHLDMKVTRDKYLKARNQNKKEKLNLHGVSSSSLLYVSILEGKNFNFEDNDEITHDPYVILKLGTNQQMSTYRPYKGDPIWNEDFTFPVISKEQLLIIEVVDQEETLGELSIYLKDLEDQNNYECWFNLSKNYQETEMQILIKIQLVWSRFIYFREKLKRIETSIKLIEVDLEELSKSIELFNKPFGFIFYSEIKSTLDKKVLNEDDMNAITNPKKFDFNNTVEFKGNDSFGPKFKKIINEWSIFTKTLIFLYIFTSLSTLIRRSDFVNFGLSSGIMYVFMTDTGEKYINKIDTFMIIFIISFFYDIIWFFLVGIAFYESRSADLSTDKWLKISVFYISILNFLVKIFLIISLISQKKKVEQLKKISNEAGIRKTRIMEIVDLRKLKNK